MRACDEPVYRGGCLCGAVRFEVIGRFEAFFLCHCTRCRHATGSAHAANLFSGTARVRWAAGGHEVRTFRLSETRHARAFCGACGSPVPSVQLNGALLVVPAGSLDAPQGLPTPSHIHCADGAAWAEHLATAPRFAQLPPRGRTERQITAQDDE